MTFSPFPSAGTRPHFADAQPRHGSAISVLVADPHCVAREGLKALVNAQPDMRVVGEARDGPAALALALELDPDLVVLEAALPGLDGAQLTARLREARPDRGVLVLTSCEHHGTARLLLGAGAGGYALKRSPTEQLVQAVRAVAAGGTYVDPGVAAGVLGGLLDVGGSGKPDAGLSDREAEVLRLLASGYSNKEIACRLRLSVKTVETYKSRAMEKLGLESRVDIVRYAVRRGWLGESGADPLLAERDSRSTS